MLQQHPKTLRLQFKDGLQKPEKANIVDTAGTKIDLNELNIGSDALGYDEGHDHEGHDHD